jgi:excisionase family DNA binding protein
VFDFLSALEHSTSMLFIKQVADMLGVSDKTIRRMIDKRDIPSVLVGGQRKFDPATLRWWYIRRSPEAQKARLASLTSSS